MKIHELYRVLRRCYLQPFTVQSNYARENAVLVAEVASRGLVTTHIGGGIHSKHWRVSSAGLALVEHEEREDES